MQSREIAGQSSPPGKWDEKPKTEDTMKAKLKMIFKVWRLTVTIEWRF